eukprot:78497-Chlamydomonas_euryale.AAC.2
MSDRFPGFDALAATQRVPHNTTRPVEAAAVAAAAAQGARAAIRAVLTVPCVAHAVPRSAYAMNAARWRSAPLLPPPAALAGPHARGVAAAATPLLHGGRCVALPSAPVIARVLWWGLPV